MKRNDYKRAQDRRTNKKDFQPRGTLPSTDPRVAAIYAKYRRTA